jgi:hypothetical protein
MDKVLETYAAMRKAADDYVSGQTDGDTLRSAVVDYTDSLLGKAVSYDIDGRIIRVQQIVSTQDK